MKNTDRRNFIKTIAGAGIVAAATPVLGLPKRATSGMDEVRRARGNQTSTLPMVDACCPMPADQAGLEAFVKAVSTYGVQGSLFVPNERGRHYPQAEMSKMNLKNSQIAKAFDSAKIAALLPYNDSAAAEEIAKCAEISNIAAAALMPSPLTDAKARRAAYEKVFAAAVRANLPIVLINAFKLSFDSEFDPQSTGKFMEDTFEIKMDGLRLVVPHFGGSFTWNFAKKESRLSDDHPYYFLAGEKISEDAFKCFKNVFGTDRLLLGSCGNMNYREVLKNVEDLSLSSGDFRKTCHQNANSLFGFEVKE